MSHTPGPWTAIPGPFSDGDWWVVGPAWFYPTPEDCVLEEADARLIAAAPELLEALEEIVRINAERDNWLWSTPVGNIAQAAIAKAKGSLTPE